MRGFLNASLLFYLLAISAVAPAQNPPAAAPRDPVLVTISEKTTRITAPLKESGYPDFLEAVNIAAKGKVTPETNGAILVLKAVGLREKYPVLTPAQKEEFYLRLGIDPLAEELAYFVSSDEFVDALPEDELPEANDEERKLNFQGERLLEIRSRVHQEFNRCSGQPWKATDYPRVAKWLKLQARAFTQLDRLREHPQCYLPTIAGTRNRSLLAVQQPLQNQIRKLVFELNIRAMNSLGEGNIDAAIVDFERILLLQSYIQQNSPGITGNLTAIASLSFAHSLFNQLMMLTPLNTKQTERVAALVSKHDTLLESMLEATDRRERLIAIDIICRAAEFGLDGTEEKTQPFRKRQEFDYELMLAQLNAAYDRLLEAGRIKNQAERMKAIDQFDTDLNSAKKATQNKAHQVLASLSKEGRSKLFADQLQAMMMPAIDTAMDIERKDQMRRELWQVAIALRQYHQQIGKYPLDLKELSPQFLPKVPLDRFADKPLQYQTNGRGVLLYSIGRDREDHHGYFGDREDDFHTDDIAIFTEDHRPKLPKVATPVQE
jgi:hypothetical protein